MPGSPHRGWPGSEAYRYLETAGCADLAWEWLRRDPDYRRLAPSSCGRTAGGVKIFAAASPKCEARWGCLNMPDPDLGFPDAPLVWSAAIDSSVLRVAASPADPDSCSAFNVRQLRAAATLVIGSQGRESLLLRDTGPSLRMDVISGSLLNGPVLLLHDFAWAGDIEPAIAALRRYLCLCRTGAFPAEAVPRNQRSGRQIRALRVYDALSQGASIRDIGMMLFGMDRVRAEWPGAGDALKSHCRRMIALARFMASGGYRMLLR